MCDQINNMCLAWHRVVKISTSVFLNKAGKGDKGLKTVYPPENGSVDSYCKALTNALCTQKT